MSRVERNIHRKSKLKKFRFLLKALFILVMVSNLTVCVFIIDKSAKDMLGPDAYLLNSFSYNIDTIKEDISKKVNEIYIKTEKIINSYINIKNKT